MSEVREDAVLKAERLGLTMVKPGEDEVFVDIDSLEDRHIFERRFRLFQKLWPNSTYTYTTSISGGYKRHAYVKVPDLSPLKEHERIALQAALNSDPFREMLAIHHGRAGYLHTSVFFEKPTAALAVT